ncbi:CDP-glucose 4,6-dehydratase [Andreprevotia lacus DSM 23236]|uniref:CDP-glucose 4,6-dehydratase n=1 Tax=Andreprevotia lacus DSM 23236 TaxID=1121001 RepID=A0A1W1Y0Z1_9NEIS|nr:CDP-glucose 4,6-dehydratase [Andreprevotia lacus]SMC29807.1 CDP-glucose 4,6-dehydratase [Andreprevotia lacus DSM 23236]
MNDAFWRGKRVLLTGHTGFKGSWLTLWLLKMGARVTGLSNGVPTSPALFDLCQFTADEVETIWADVRSAEVVAAAIAQVQPDIVLHLAAQPLVREGYKSPVETFATNVMGTAHVLDAVVKTASVRAAVIVTTDKCYQNKEWVWPYREDEPLGGHDPYSASKAAAELVTTAMRLSFARPGLAIASARAGNVIGGGDWAADRLVPDCVQAFAAGQPMTLRRPGAVRPWQHVLDPLAGYLRLAECLFEGTPLPSSAWNFGPNDDDCVPVGQIAELVAQSWGSGEIRIDAAQGPHEAGLLKLDSSLARAHLGWRSRWRLRQSVQKTVAWYRAWHDGEDMRAFTLNQIAEYGAEQERSAV